MKVAITGADGPLGGLLCHRLSADHEVVPLGMAVEPLEDLLPHVYQRVDLRLSEEVGKVMEGIEAVVHALPFDSAVEAGRQAEQELLDRVARSTYVVLTEACRAEIKRVVIISQIALMEDYPENYVVEPDWCPLPRAEAGSLAPYLAELVGREIARTGRLEVVCLRFGQLEAAGGTSRDDAAQAVQEALVRTQSNRTFAYLLQHIVSGGRFAHRQV